MRIGAFSKKYDISESTVRYYIDLGLLVPNKINKQYIFDERCCERLKLIKKLKNINFSLEEISNILVFLLITEVGEKEGDKYFVNLFENKKKDLIKQRKEINSKIHHINSEIDIIKSKQQIKDELIGVPIEFIKYLYCPICKKQLVINKGKIDGNMIINGELNCTCGFSAKIVEGIVVVNELHTADINIDLNCFKEKYIKNTDKNFIKLMHEAGNWIVDKIDFSSLSNKVVMKNNTGIGVFIRNLCDKFPEDCNYIAVDNNFQILKQTKMIIERKKKRPNIMFVCSDFKSLPIKDKCVDIIIDKICGSYYDFQKIQMPMVELKDKLKDNGRWIGNYIYFKSGCYPVQLRKEYRQYFTLDKLYEIFQEYYKEIESKNFGSYTMEIGEYGSFLNVGDVINQWIYYGYKK